MRKNAVSVPLPNAVFAACKPAATGLPKGVLIQQKTRMECRGAGTAVIAGGSNGSWKNSGWR